MYVNYAAYRDGKRLGEITVEQISDILATPESFVWMALADPEPEELLKIQEEFGLHELAAEDARSAHQRCKLEDYGDCLFLVLHPVEMVGEQVHYGETHLFVGRDYLVSIRHGSREGYGRVRLRCEGSPHLLAKGPGFALYGLLDFIVDQFMPVVEHFQDRLETLEQAIFENQHDRASIEQLYDLKREVANLRNAVAPILDICNALMRLHPDIVSRELKVYYRDVHDHVVRIVRNIDTMRDILTDAMQVYLALVTIRQNDVVKRLAGWGAILAIPTMIFSMYGMNFKFMPELVFPYGYPAALLVTLLGCAALYRKLKFAGWL